MKMVSQYKYIVCNDDPKLAAELIKTIILRHVELEENKELQIKSICAINYVYRN